MKTNLESDGEEKSTSSGTAVYSVLALIIIVMILSVLIWGVLKGKRNEKPENADGNTETEIISETDAYDELKLHMEELEKKVEMFEDRIVTLEEKENMLGKRVELQEERTEMAENAEETQQSSPPETGSDMGGVEEEESNEDQSRKTQETGEGQTEIQISTGIS